MMPGLPTMTPEQDIVDFKQLFEDDRLKPDMLKIYPSLVIPDTEIYNQFQAGQYVPYSDQDMIKVLTEIKKMIPNFEVNVMSEYIR